jgi:hypothetical protein
LSYLVRICDVRQQTQNTRTFDFTGEFPLATGAISGLATGLDFAHFVNIAFECIDIFVIETFAFWTVFATSPTAAAWTGGSTTTTVIVTVIAVIIATETVSTATTTSTTSFASIVV